MTESALQKAERQLAQAKARLQSVRNRETLAERKMDTRRKVILGGALMDLASRDSTAAAMVDRLLRNLPREQDRAAFDGWSLGGGEAGEASAVNGAPVADRVDPGGGHDDVGRGEDRRDGDLS